jgi:Fur family peroxide stress response transcriptional regulator
MTAIRKHSHKRDALLEKLRGTTSHPTALWIYDELRKDIPDISLGTVYRNLAAFKAEGLIISVGIVNGQERFDANTSEHTHFVCLSCGEVIDVDAEIEPSLKESVEVKYGLDIFAQQLTLYGRCGQCQESGLE